MFEDVASPHKQGKKHKDLLIKQMGCKEFTSFLQDHLTAYIKHNFVAKWQSQQFKECIWRFPREDVVSIIDFAENYSFKE